MSSVRFFCLIGLVALSPLSLGCSKQDPNRGQVTGTVEVDGQPAAEGRRAVGPVGMLEGQDEAARAVVIAQRRPRPVEGRRLDRAGSAERRVGQGVGQGIAAQAALRRGEEGERPPAARAEPALALDDRAAGEAARRQHGVEEAQQGALGPDGDCHF